MISPSGNDYMRKQMPWEMRNSSRFVEFIRLQWLRSDAGILLPIFGHNRSKCSAVSSRLSTMSKFLTSNMNCWSQKTLLTTHWMHPSVNGISTESFWLQIRIIEGCSLRDTFNGNVAIYTFYLSLSVFVKVFLVFLFLMISLFSSSLNWFLLTSLY